MPPFISVKCPHCHQQNNFDKTMLDSTDVGAKDIIYHANAPAQEYYVTCEHCHKSFKITLKAGSDE